MDFFTSAFESPKVGQEPTDTKKAEKERKVQEKKAQAEAKKLEQQQKKEEKKREKEAKKQEKVAAKAAGKENKASKPKKEKDPNAPKKSFFGKTKKTPRAEYQAKIDDLQLQLNEKEQAFSRQSHELQQLKNWARSAPV